MARRHQVRTRPVRTTPLFMLAILLAALALAIPTLAWAGQLDVKTGSWEMTSRMQMQGAMMNPGMMANIPPEARAQVEAAMGAMNKPHTRRQCITAEQLQRGFDMIEGHDSGCHHQVISATSDSMEVRGSCASDGTKSTMHGVFHAANRESFAGTIDMDTVSEDGPHHATLAMTGKFLGPDCTAADNDDADK